VSIEGAAFGQGAHDKTPCDAAGEQAELALVLAACFVDEVGVGAVLACPLNLARAASFDNASHFESCEELFVYSICQAGVLRIFERC
jgi:hypothetical protein